MSDQEILKIEIEPEDDGSMPPLTPEVSRGADVKGQAARLGETVSARVRQGVTAVAAKSSEVVRDQVTKAAEQQTQAAMERIRETDWQQAGKQGLVGGLRWLSHRLAALADRFQAADKKNES